SHHISSPTLVSSTRSPFISRPMFLPLLFFLRTIPRPPTSTLFPYTTLFRSVYKQQPTGFRAEFHDRLVAPLYPIAFTVLCFAILDRKSTRLNSSHGSISYAVFCLKKKIAPPAVVR